MKLTSFQTAYRDTASTVIKQIKSTNPLDAEEGDIEQLDQALEDMRTLLGIAVNVRSALDDAILPKSLKVTETEESEGPVEEDSAEDLDEVFGA